MIKIVIVEDEPAIARGLSLMITQSGPDFQVLSVCKNGIDGLEAILRLKPDLVFSDIEMPAMNGLEMIAHMQESGFRTRCVILTGYSDFEYARTAISLGVTDYLLKPIAPDALNRILLSCREQARSTLRILQTEYLQRCLFQDSLHTRGSNPLLGYDCTLMILFWGPMHGNNYTEAILHTEKQLPDAAQLHVLEEAHQLSIFSLSGLHYNEHIYALVYPEGASRDLSAIAESLSGMSRSSSTYLHLSISETIHQGEGIHVFLHNAYLFSMSHNPYGFDTIQKCEPFQNDLPIQVSLEVRQACATLPSPASQEPLFSILHSIISYWEQTRAAQFQIVSDLKFFFGCIFRSYSKENRLYPDISELVSTCHSYAELEKEIQYELQHICGFSNEFLSKGQQPLAYRVKNWLDNNFTAQITGKNFQDLFGRSGKYISTLFKSEFGMSPNKYVSELRLQMAKKLMESNPAILLKDVAELVGFTDAFYFSKVFKTCEGISPSQYLENLKEQEKH